MKLYLYAYRDPKLGCYQSVMTVSEDEEHVVTGIRRNLLKADNATKAKFRDLSICSLGEYDDETGVITAHAPVILCDLAPCCVEVVENGREESK